MNAEHLTDDVRNLLAGCREQPELLPLLADALEEAGFDDADALVLLRTPGHALAVASGTLDFVAGPAVDDEALFGRLMMRGFTDVRRSGSFVVARHPSIPGNRRQTGWRKSNRVETAGKTHKRTARQWHLWILEHWSDSPSLVGVAP